MKSKIYSTEGHKKFNAKVVVSSKKRCALTLKQEGLDLQTVHRHTRMLVKHLNECYKVLYSTKYRDISDFMPQQVMYRCFMVARSILSFELAAIFTPQEVKVDPQAWRARPWSSGAFSTRRSTMSTSN